ncbi:kinase-like protein [Rozella allomycis CSF55]|uniref:Kinase-like protein n=1 Tax=Rozella allomycis (strain CSF55) TaxID=988480 RepID=A0A075B0P2_ROZAC|nr:Protein kinase, catalytic domain-containing protein [Rozella allomycis CSF55]RKP21697.1 kinase-like protein [Rozella allomycis CSF55]|eukprot:EPZ34539.1 Protein kinase, catalytic domain-containing protein [Rozella allomycis CSF55]
MDKVQSSQSSLRETRSITESSLTSLNGDPPIRQLNQYLLTDILGSGSYGTVHLAREVDQPNSQYAIKELSKSRLAKLSNNPFKKSPQANNAGKLDCVKKEIAILKKVIHPYIVRLFEVLDDPSVDSLFMVFELLGSPIQQVSLYEPYDPLPIEKAQKYFQQLVLGIEFRTFTNPDNILKTGSDSIKLVDFGVSEMFISSDDTLRGSKTSTTSAFLAPELISCKKIKESIKALSNVSGKSADIWAMGVTLYSMIFGKLPFKGRGLAELYENIKNKE